MINKAVLLQFAVKTLWPYFITDSAGIWYFDFNGTWTGIAASLATSLIALSENIENVNQVIADGTGLTQVNSYTNTVTGRASALASAPSFIWDGENDIIYIRLADWDPPDLSTITLGVTINVSNQAYDDTVNDILHRPDLMGIPGLAEQKDPLFYQRLAFDEFTQDINNSGQKYDYLQAYNLFGAQADYYYGNIDSAFSTFTQIKAGKIKSYTYNDNKFSLRIKDGRKALSKTLPPNKLSQTTYTNLKDEYSGTRIPLVYGQVKDHKCIPLDDDAVQVNYTFMIADTEIYNLYPGTTGVDFEIVMDDTNKAANVLNFSASAGTFQLPAAHYTVGKTVTYTGPGFVSSGTTLVDNPLDIVKHWLSDYLSITYNSDNYNTTEWAAETTAATDGGLVISQPTSIIEAISDIAGQTGAGFLLDRDGRYTWRSFDSSKFRAVMIRQHQWKRFPSVTIDSDEILTSATAKYNKSIASGRWSRYEDDSQKTEIFNVTDEEINKEFDTIYTNATDAQTFAESIMERSGVEPKTFTGIVDDKYIDLSEVKIGELAQIEINRLVNGQYVEWLGIMLCEILEVIPNIDERECALKFRRIEDATQFELFRWIVDDLSNTDFIVDSISDGVQPLYADNIDIGT